MSTLYGVGGSGELLAETSPERCKPNYEEQIKRAREKLNTNDQFRSWLIKFMQSGSVRNPDNLFQLLGELDIAILWQEKTIAQLISEQEKEGK